MSVELIAIGASAGGFEAVSGLLPAFKPGLRAAVIVVLHLPPDGASLAAELLASRCAVPLTEPFDKQPIEPGHVYVAPRDHHLLIERSRTFALSIDAPVHYSRPSIDVTLETAASVYGEKMLGIILTGANEDGAAGLARVHAAGGKTWVQSPETAQASSMPRAAIQRAQPDRILALSEMLPALGRLVS